MKPQDNIELKEKFEETLTNDGLFEDDLRGYRKMKTNNATIVWNFFLPHLKDDNKIRREAVRGFVEYVIPKIVGLDLTNSEIKWVKDKVEEYLKKEEK